MSLVRAEETEGWMVVEVTDTGAGISKENQQKLFKQVGPAFLIQP